jgi:hypothetical protein
MHINNEMLQVLELGLSVIVIGEQFLYQFGFCLFEGDVVGITAKNVLKLTLQLVDIIIGLASEFKFNFFVLGLHSFLLLCAFVEIFAKVVNNSVVMMPVLLPKDAQLVLIRFDNNQNSVSDLKAILKECLEVSLIVVLLIDCEVSFCLVESHVGRVDVMIFKEGFLDISEGNRLLLFNRESIDNTR